VLIAGVDLAAEPKGTALAVIDWSAGSANLVELKLNVDDSDIVRTAGQVEKLGIDCALGWPIAFVEFLSDMNRASGADAPFSGDLDLRRKLAYRETDRVVREITGRWPLSVSTDRLGMTAIRCAGLLSQIAAAGIEVDRSGAGCVVEIYPGATLRLWGFDTSGYRASSEIRARLLTDIRAEAPWLDLGAHERLMLESCDAFDAVIAALAARSAQLGRSSTPAHKQLEQARAEGWVALPIGPIGNLLTVFDS
jgi:predicted nuclease with RNAse H fold